MREIKKGQMITFAEGEYSDYCVNGLVVAITDFDLSHAKDKWQVENAQMRKNKYQSRPRLVVTGMDFLPWLVKHELVEDVEYIEVHTGSYGEVDIEITET